MALSGGQGLAIQMFYARIKKSDYIDFEHISKLVKSQFNRRKTLGKPVEKRRSPKMATKID